MASNHPTGEAVNLDIPCVFPPCEKITGSLVDLLPLQGNHAEHLFRTIGGEENASLYTFMPQGPFSSLEEFRGSIKQWIDADDPQIYAIVDKQNGKLVGRLGYLRIDVANRVIEIGHIVYSPSLQRTTQATEVFYLLAKKAFECGYRRLEWKCDTHNAASRRAALRYGYTFEGIFRQHMIRKGRNRDSAWYSILDKEWPNRKAALEDWMDPNNFDEAGGQKRTLEKVRSQT